MSWYVILAAGGLGGAAMLASWLLRRRLRIVTVRGDSMLPALSTGDRLLVRRVPLARIRPGDIVVLSIPAWEGARPSAAALAEMPSAFKDGSPVAEAEFPVAEAEFLVAELRVFEGDAWLIKRAVAVPGDPVPPEVASTLDVASGTPVPPGALVVLGDNRDASVDSRLFGYVTDDDLLGVVLRPFGTTAPAPPGTPAFPR